MKRALRKDTATIPDLALRRLEERTAPAESQLLSVNTQKRTTAQLKKLPKSTSSRANLVQKMKQYLGI